MEYRGIKLADSVKLYKKCGKRNLRTKNSIDKLVDKMKENGHDILSRYYNAHAKVLIDFNCAHEPHWIDPSSYKSGKGCPSCGANRANKGRVEQAEKELILLIANRKHELLSKYINAYEKVLVDFKCGHKPHWIAPAKYKEGKGCPSCGGRKSNEKKLKQAKEEFVQLIKGNGHEVLSEYIDSHAKLLIDFKCQHNPRWITPTKYKEGQWCSKCSNRCSEQAEENLIKLVEKNGHELLERYINAKTKISIDFKCGHPYHPITPDQYKKGGGCPICRTSKGEKAIVEWLQQQEINFIHQHTFRDLPNRVYDIYLPDYNLVIEVHGIQHFEEVDWTEISLEEQQWVDALKEDFARRNEINYMVVDYREGNPQLTSERFIEQYQSI